MRREKCKLISVRDKRDLINHGYIGRKYGLDFDSLDPLAHELKEEHEKILTRDYSIERVETRIIRRNY